MRVKLGRLLRGVSITALVAAGVSCGTTPVAPAPTLPGPVHNAPPVIASLTTTAVPRMEVDQDVTVSAVVTDTDASVAKLTLLWSANVGTITGSGSTVTWRLPKGAATTPADVTITLNVIEKYDNVDASGAAIVSENHVTQATTPFRVHDSDAELTKMGVHFLVDLFGNSSIGADACLVDFSDTCPGKQKEHNDIVSNRQDFLIFSGAANVTGITYDAPKNVATSALVTAPCSWHDEFLATGKTGITASTCFLTGVYLSQRWWLCASTIDPNGTCGSCPTIAGSPAHPAWLTKPTMLLNDFFRLSIIR